MSADRDHLTRRALVGLQLLAALGVFWVYQLETPNAFRVLALAVAAFLFGGWIPHTQRLAYFAMVSVIALPLTMGFSAAATVLAIGAVLLTVMHLPVRFSIRLAVVAALWGGLTALRYVAPSLEVPRNVWPALGTMFMFRLAVYLYALRYEPVSFSRWHGVAYFFMLSSAVYPIFPIVDYGTFARAADAEDDPAQHERGVAWIFRGITQLLLYRFVYFGFTVGELWANNLHDVLQHVVSAFLLYLHVSGTFHLIVGVLHCFGFRLPETHQRYLLASSFGDFWRRINIYWKDAIVKLVFQPVFFRLRTLGHRTALLLATVVSFVVTWALHSYQYLWLQGTPLIKTTDVLFWTVFGVLVVGTTYWESRPRRPRRRATTWSARLAFSRVGTISVILVLWSFWVSESIGTWRTMWTMTRYAAPADVAWMLAALTVVVVLAGFRWDATADDASDTTIGGLTRQAVGRVAVCAGLAALMLPSVQHAAPASLRQTMAHLHGDGLARQDEFIRVGGYYRALESPLSGRVDAWRQPIPEVAFDFAAGFVNRDDFLMGGIRPNMRSLFLGQPFSTNRFGMRDRDYDEAKPADVFRIVLIGPSYVLGWGVGDSETIDVNLEARLDSLARRSGRRVEVLNVSFPAWSVAQETYAIDALAARFHPDVIVLALHPFELMFAADRLRDAMSRGIAVPDSELRAVIQSAGISPGVSAVQLRERLRIAEPRWHQRVFSWASELGASHGARVVGLAMAVPGEEFENTQRVLLRAAQAVRFDILACTRVFHGVRTDLVAVSASDHHPNALGSRMLADCAFRELLRHGLIPAEFLSR